MDTAHVSLPAFPSPPDINLRQPVVAQPTPSLASVIASSLLSNSPPPSSSQPATGGSINKETAPSPHQPIESTHLVEVRESEPLPAEVEGWLQKLDAAGEIKLPEPITHDGDVLLANTEAQVVKEKIVLPMTQTGVQLGLTQKVNDSARWLAVWCIRLIKMMKGGVKYAEEPTRTF